MQNQAPSDNGICVHKRERMGRRDCVSMAEHHRVQMSGVEGIDCIADHWRLRGSSSESNQDQIGKKLCSMMRNGEISRPCDTTLASIDAKEDEHPARTGTGSRVTVRAFSLSKLRKGLQSLLRLCRFCPPVSTQIWFDQMGTFFGSVHQKRLTSKLVLLKTNCSLALLY